MSRAFIGGITALALMGCASSVPSNFSYETSLRDEQGFIGLTDKISAAESLLAGGVVTDPAAALQTALPDAEIKVRKWGLRYFNANWSRYQVILDANIRRGDVTTMCREVSTQTPVGAPKLNDLRANEGQELQSQLERLVAACVHQSKDLT